jgi:hypothetical protein
MSGSDPKLNGRQRESRSWNASVFSFRSIGANVAKFSRSLDEATFSPRAFLISHGLVAEAIDFPACHFGCLATPASFAELTRCSCCAVSKTAFHEQSDRHFPRGKITLSAAPLVQRRQNRRAKVHFKALSFFFHGDSSIFERQE